LAEPDHSTPKTERRQLVKNTAAKLRDLILSREVGANIGSLKDVAQMLGVGIVTLQQAARILEHEGLLAVRRGPGGGYYGTRPDEAALERGFAAYLRVHGFSYRESQQLLALLDCELMPAAALCRDETLLRTIAELRDRVDRCDTPELRVEVETQLRHTLFKMVSQPLIEFVVRVTGRLYTHPRSVMLFGDAEGVATWKAGRGRILSAILQHDPELARFEAERYRKEVLARLERYQEPTDQGRSTQPPST
jgi:GntR family transcriptional repressor for pyruvate dehydrogenase complex